MPKGRECPYCFSAELSSTAAQSLLPCPHQTPAPRQCRCLKAAQDACQIAHPREQAALLRCTPWASWQPGTQAAWPCHSMSRSNLPNAPHLDKSLVQGALQTRRQNGLVSPSRGGFASQVSALQAVILLPSLQRFAVSFCSSRTRLCCDFRQQLAGCPSLSF